jgi:hypothetical protein
LRAPQKKKRGVAGRTGRYAATLGERDCACAALSPQCCRLQIYCDQLQELRGLAGLTKCGNCCTSFDCIASVLPTGAASSNTTYKASDSNSTVWMYMCFYTVAHL